MSIKKTQKQYFEEILNALVTKDITHLNDEHNEFLKSRIDALDKKSTSRKPTAEQKRAEEVGQAILDYMKPSTLYTVTDLFKSVPAFIDEDTFQYANAVVQKLYKGGMLDRISEKGKTYFRLA